MKEQKQADKFKQAAREHGADEDEQRWEERLKKVAKANPAKASKILERRRFRAGLINEAVTQQWKEGVYVANIEFENELVVGAFGHLFGHL